jgi:hypothetical protein
MPLLRKAALVFETKLSVTQSSRAVGSIGDGLRLSIRAVTGDQPLPPDLVRGVPLADPLAKIGALSSDALADCGSVTEPAVGAEGFPRLRPDRAIPRGYKRDRRRLTPKVGMGADAESIGELPGHLPDGIVWARTDINETVKRSRQRDWV